LKPHFYLAKPSYLYSYLRRIIYLAVFFCGAFSSVFAQSSKAIFKHLTIDNGLSQNTVYSILQDHEGFIWIGTEDGLNKYDGYEFTIYKHDVDHKNSLSNSQINALLEDNKGNLWIGTSDGINIYDRKHNQFSHIYTLSKKSSEANDYITALMQDKKGNIWAATYDGLKFYDPATKTFTRYLAGNDELDLQSKKVQTIFENSDGVIWVGTNKNLELFDTYKRKYIPIPAILENNALLKGSGIRAIKQDKNGAYWIGTESVGVFCYDPAKNTCINYRQQANNRNSLLSDIVRDVFIVDGDEIWIGTRDGLSVLKDGHFINYEYDKYDQDALSHNSVRYIMQDKSKNIWVGTYAGGVNVFYAGSNNFIHLPEQIGATPGLSHRVVSTILNNGNGTFWVGTEGGGLNYVDRKTNFYQSFSILNEQKKLTSNNVKSLVKDEYGNIWVGAYDGLAYFNVKNHSLKIYKSIYNYPNPADNQIYALSSTSNGVWIGTNGAGFQFMDNSGKLTRYTSNNKDEHSLSSNNISSLLKDENGNGYWIGTQRGVNYFDLKTQKFTQFRYNDADKFSLNCNSVLTLFIDSKQHLWIGTEGGGLSYFDRKTNKFYAINEREGLANNVVHAINEDKGGNIWVSTNRGLFKIEFKNFTLPFKSSDLSISNYSVTDGLQSNQFSSNSTVRDDQGQLLFGGINGISYFDPYKISINKFKPPVVFTDFLIRNKSVSITDEESPLKNQINETDEITLTHDQGFISFRFAALNYISADKNQYAYKMEGFKDDDDWHYVGSQRMATFTNLNAGTYYFKVKAANNDGLWNTSIKSIKLIVLPPWWKTWWAYLIYTLIIGSLLYTFYYYSFKTARLKNDLIFEQLNHEKDQELSQRKLSFFTNISHEIKTPLTLILAPLEKLVSMNEGNNKIQNQLMLMQRNGERLIRLINQLLDFRKFESGNMNLQSAEGNIARFINEIFIAFEAYAKSKKISFKFNSKEDEIKAFFDRDKLEKILYNLLSNALKFTPAGGKISVNIKTDNGHVLISVEDNGQGIPEQNIDKIFECFNHFSDARFSVHGTGIGLSFSKGLVELHHGELLVESSVATDTESGYTCFTVKLPLGSAHLKPEEINPDFKDSENIAQYYTPGLDPEQQLIRTAEMDIENVDKPLMLVVEDNIEVLNFIASTFTNDYNVYTAEDGLKGWQMATEIIPDIIISDVMMPNMNGITLCNQVKSDIRTSHIPIILLSARTPLIFKIEGLETGADDYITKPFSVSVLETRVRNLVESRKKLRDRYRKEISLQPRNVAITSPDEKFLSKVMNFIEANISEPILTVEELGKEIGMSRVTLYRKIKALTNQTAIEFIRGVRIKRAAQLLEQNKFNVNEVSYMVGFMDVDYFRKCFKEQFGYTPKEYINHLTEK
jgi:ligand-binding sensor domain-containing protein/signal transduction histidine kinase/DNA-binding response OmpR family regulator